MSLPMTIDLGSIYRASRLRVASLVDDSVSDRAVPATPLGTPTTSSLTSLG